MEGFVLLTKRAVREFHFLPGVGDVRALPIDLFFSIGPRAILSPRFVCRAAENFGAAVKMNLKIDPSETQRNRCVSADSISLASSTPSSISPSYFSSTTSSISATTSRGQHRPAD
jgi:hypothetical protein